MKLADVCTADEYLRYYDEQIDLTNIQKLFPKVTSLYHSLCNEFRELCETQLSIVFQIVEKMFRIDAQLQIITELLKQSSIIDDQLSDDELVRIIEDGKDSFYREMIGLKVTDQPPWGLMFLSDRVSQNE